MIKRQSLKVATLISNDCHCEEKQVLADRSPSKKLCTFTINKWIHIKKLTVNIKQQSMYIYV